MPILTNEALRAVLQHNRRGQGLLRRRCGLVVRRGQRRPGRRHRRGVGPVCPHRHSQLRRLQLPREAGRPDARVRLPRVDLREHREEGHGTAAPPTFCAGIGDGGGGEGGGGGRMAAETRAVRARTREGASGATRRRRRPSARTRAADCEGLRAHVRPLHPKQHAAEERPQSIPWRCRHRPRQGAVRRLPSVTKFAAAAGRPPTSAAATRCRRTSLDTASARLSCHRVGKLRLRDGEVARSNAPPVCLDEMPTHCGSHKAMSCAATARDQLPALGRLRAPGATASAAEPTRPRACRGGVAAGARRL